MAGSWPGHDAFISSESPHDDFGAEGDAAVEIDDVLVEEADAARGDVAADLAGLVGAMNAVEGVAFALMEIERAGAQRIELAAVETVRDELAKRCGALNHLLRGMPGRPFGAPCDMRRARPGEALSAHAYGIAQGSGSWQHQIK